MDINIAINGIKTFKLKNDFNLSEVNKALEMLSKNCVNGFDYEVLTTLDIVVDEEFSETNVMKFAKKINVKEGN